MCFKRAPALAALLPAAVLLMTALPARAEPPLATLEVAPVQCVALHRGQTCHFDARLRWQARQ
ncbi:MAG: hypothetical protein ACT6S0_20170, partial [Roseateles sp.]